jgi:molybdopterin converting factor small subunit
MIEINIKIEFYGRARMILGLNSFEIQVNEKITKEELISLIGKKYPKLIGEIIEENKSNLKKSYNIGINGIKNPSENELNLKNNDSILIFSSQAGG